VLQEAQSVQLIQLDGLCFSQALFRLPQRSR
jgi:hypothetical protein